MKNKMKEYFIYDDKIYESEEDVEEAIIEKIGHNYNNMDVTQTSEFQYEIEKIETVRVKEKKMTKEQKKRIIKEAYYMTQYASYSSDEGVYEALISSIEENETDFDLVIEFLELTRNATDFINQEVYDSVFYNLTDDKLNRLIKLYEAIENESINDLENLFGVSYYDLFDNYIGDYDYFETLADYDLKYAGIESSAIYWADKIPNDGAIYELDVYYNFNEVTFDDILDRLFENFDLNDIL